MPKLGLETDVVDQQVYDNTVDRFRQLGIVLPTFSQLADPTQIPEGIISRLEGVDPDSSHPLNLFRIHWYNRSEGQSPGGLPEMLELPESLTGVKARILVLLADTFPMIQAHKVLATYGCLAPRIVTGQYDPTAHRAIWPSTGNYCRGGIAVSRIMGCRGVAVLPEGMSRERFDWLERWASDPGDVIRTPGSESNVKEIYDKCAELDRDPANIIFNQFSEFGNYLAHWLCTGTAAAKAYESLANESPGLRLSAFVSATGSGGTLAAGDHLKERFGARIVAVEALECPTLLYNGFGEHNIQGIGDKHIPLIHNVMNTDVVTAISDRATDGLNLVFNTASGREFLVRRLGLSSQLVEQLGRLGLSSICNVLAAIKTARHFRMGEDDLLVTVATDGASMYVSEREKHLYERYGGSFDEVDAAQAYGRHLLATTTDHFLELNENDRMRIFNLGYFTWVEQQGLSIEDFVRRREPEFWLRLRDLVPAWDERIEEFNARTAS